MQKYFNKLTRHLKPADIFVFSVFSVFQFFIYWWYRKLFFLAAFLLLLSYYTVYSAVFRIDRKPLLRSFDFLDLTAVLFCGALFVSSFLSEYRAYSVGILYNQEGLIIYLFYIAAFILLRRAVHFERRHFYLFVAVGCIVSAISVPVFFGVSGALNILPVLKPPAALTTYVNVNMFSQILILYFSVNFLLSLRQNDFFIRVFHFAAELLFMFCAIITQCDGLIVFFAAFFIILPFTVKIDLAVIRRSALCVSAFFFALALFNIFGKYASQYSPSLLIALAQNIPFYVTLTLGAVIFAAALKIKSDTKKDFTKLCRWAFPCLIIFCVAAAFLFWKEPLFRYLGFYGGSRGALITTVLSAYGKVFSPVQKLFGTGICSFGDFLYAYCPYLIPKNLSYELLYPHNFISELIFETGAAGFIACGTFLLSALINAFKCKDECRRIAFTAVLLYLITRLFYVPSPQLTPIALLFLAGCSPVLKKNRI